MFICVLLPTIVLIVQIVIDKWSLPFGIYTVIALSLTLSVILEHLVQFAVKCSAAKFSIFFDHVGNCIKLF